MVCVYWGQCTLNDDNHLQLQLHLFLWKRKKIIRFEEVSILNKSQQQQSQSLFFGEIVGGFDNKHEYTIFKSSNCSSAQQFPLFFLPIGHVCIVGIVCVYIIVNTVGPLETFLLEVYNIGLVNSPRKNFVMSSLLYRPIFEYAAFLCYMRSMCTMFCGIHIFIKVESKSSPVSLAAPHLLSNPFIVLYCAFCGYNPFGHYDPAPILSSAKSLRISQPELHITKYPSADFHGTNFKGV